MGSRGDSGHKQQNISRLSQHRADAANTLSWLLHLTSEFNATLDKCSASAKVEAVHRVRSGSRRIQVLVETLLSEQSAEVGPLEQPARTWLRRLKRLRRAAGPVRDLDVHSKLLKKTLAGRTAGRVGVSAAEGKELSAAIGEDGPLREQAARLAAWLKHERQKRAKALQKYIRKHLEDLAEPGIAFLAAADRLRRRRANAADSAALMALEDFARLADRMPLLDAGNLHEFRKAVKRARYVAESGGDDRSSQTVADTLAKVQEAIGIWHDWFSLTQQAQTALGGDGIELTAWLAVETGRHFRRALAVSKRVRGELLDEWMAAQNAPPAKLPSRAVAPAGKSKAG